MTKILDGKSTAKEICAEVASTVGRMKSNHNVTPGLAAVLVGDDPASSIYVRNKGKACHEADIYSQTFNLPIDVTEKELLKLLQQLNDDRTFHGILVQLPLPDHLDESRVLDTIDPRKDVDCLHPTNVGLLSQGRSDFVPATPGGIQQLLIRNSYKPDGKHVVICGRSNIVGKPLAMLLAQKKVGADATVTMCHTKTPNMGDMTKQADILVVAMGRPKAIGANMVKEGAVVVDVGINRVNDATRKQGYRLVGDVDYEQVFDKVEAITPVPGGVGPMTIAMLLVNTMSAANLSIHG